MPSDQRRQGLQDQWKRAMEYYQYQPLKDGDIRIVTLLPGGPDTDLRIKITHTLLNTPSATMSCPKNGPHLERTLPARWKIRETLEKRYIFVAPREDGAYATFTHPDDNISPETHDSTLMQDPLAGLNLSCEAISYRWVAEDHIENVYVETTQDAYATPSSSNVSDARILKISRNVASALRSLRFTGTSRDIWIDGICINQTDHSEKSRQIERMADIYMLAYRVVVWLGPRSPDSALAIRTLSYLGDQVEYTLTNGIMQSPGCQEHDWFKPSVKLPYDEKTWLAISNLLHREWFERLWVWQEVHVANHRAIMYCDNESISWYRFRAAVLCLQNNEHNRTAELHARLTLIQRITRKPPDQSHGFFGLITTARNHATSEPRDRIYALLGLAKFLSLPIVEHIRPDYTLPVVDVYHHTCLADLRVSGFLGSLRLCDLGARKLGGPTWVPDLSSPRLCKSLLTVSLSASGWSRSFAEVGACSSEIRVYAVVAEAICSVSPAFVHLTTEQIGDRLRASEPSGLFETTHATGATLVDVYMIALCGGKVKDQRPFGAAYPDLQACRSSYLRNISSGKTLVDADINADLFLRSVYDTITGRTILQSRNHVGLGPSAACIGDIIAVILGCPIPILLRPIFQNPHVKYQVVGECYIEGIMNAEALLGPLPSGWFMELRYNLSRGTYMAAYSNRHTGETTWERPVADGIGGESRQELDPEILLARGVKLRRLTLI